MIFFLIGLSYLSRSGLSSESVDVDSELVSSNSLCYLSIVMSRSSVSQLNLCVSCTVSKESPTMIMNRFIKIDIERNTQQNMKIGPKKESNYTTSMKVLEISSPNIMQ